MKTKFKLLTACICLSAFVFAQQPQPIPDQYIVILKESASQPVKKQEKKNNNREQKAAANKPARDKALAKVKAIHEKKNIKSSAIISEYTEIMVGFSAKLTAQEKKALEDDPEVEAVIQDYVIEIDPMNPEPNPSDVGFMDYEQKNSGISIESGPSLNSSPTDVDHEAIELPAQYLGCNITKAGGFADGSSKSTFIWILDTGIDIDHPDLNVVTKYGKSFIFLRPSLDDEHGHGTHCAGIAAAKNNSIGVVGVSAGAKVVPVKVLNNDGKGSWSTLISGLDHVAKYDVKGDVVSMSIGGYGYSNCENSNNKLRDAIRLLGSTGTYVVMAAGNDGADAKLNRPGCVNGTNVFTVASIECSNGCSSFSNFNTSSSVPVDWVAVGKSVYSTCKGGYYCTKSGTSMATPAVAGIIHARGGAPLSGGTVTCKNKTYKIAKR